ncbi:MAG TPA: carboxypeptidase regulatory-like domain-containing protein, partial [Bryobacteraceae bacterium]|nr:carboxypeptidase regulatory-like domain-containing protein [Bryobacteraceae bacterium]
MQKPFVFLALACITLIPGRAQTVTGSITGTVTDPAGAVVPNATVTAKNVDTNIATETKTSSAGVYNLLFLPVGRYTISVQAPGFKSSSLAPFELGVNQTARADVKMEVGVITESVSVEAAAPALQTESAQTGDVISSTQSSSLPLNGRNFVSLTLLAPGSITPYPNNFNNPSRSFGGGRPYVNGNREQTNNFLLDGVDINEPIDNLVAYNPNVDAIAEMRVLTGNASAEFGNASGATVIMATKSGTNEFHGNLFEFLR